MIPTSNHNLVKGIIENAIVVYLLIPTSNHNLSSCSVSSNMLYIFWFLHQTTTWWDFHRFRVLLYIFWFLHQTTTCHNAHYIKFRCISFDSYIKPQLLTEVSLQLLVVYLLIPTSNHNDFRLGRYKNSLYIFWFLHQTTTPRHSWFDGLALYIFWFLHQTTTMTDTLISRNSCISFDSYIKPQQV